MGERNSYRAAAGIFFLIFGLLGLGDPRIVAAISFSQPVLSFDNDVGIDYSFLTGNLVTSVHFASGNPSNLESVNQFTGVRTDLTGFSGRGDELKLAVARPTSPGCPQNVPVGTIFTSNGTANQGINAEAQVVMVSPSGGANPSGAVLHVMPLPGEKSDLRGGFYFDYRCVIATALGTQGLNHLVVVSGDEDSFSSKPGGKVWIIPISAGPLFGLPIQVAAITRPNPCFGNPATPGCSLNAPATIPAHLEGVIVVPNDSKYGPWAGKIVTGDEDRFYLKGANGDTTVTHGASPMIYAIDPVSHQILTSTTSSPGADQFQMVVENGPIGLPGGLPHPEDFDFIEGDFYGAAYNQNMAPHGGGQGHILRAPFGDFPPNLGDILIHTRIPYGSIAEWSTHGRRHQLGSLSGQMGWR